MSNIFQNNLKKLRELNNWTQEQLADMLGIARATYSKIELGTKEAGINTLTKLADIFKVTTDQLLGNDIKFLTPNTKPTEFRDYLYINQDKLKSYLGSLGYSDIGKILHIVSTKHELNGGGEGSLNVLGNSAKINGDFNREKNKEESWEENKKIENFANILMEELDKQGFIESQNAGNIDSSGKFIKIKTNISFVRTPVFMKNLFDLMNQMRQYGVTIDIPQNAQPFLDMVAKDLELEIKNKKVSFLESEINFYGELKDLDDEQEEKIEGALCTIVAKIVKKVTKPKQTVLELKSLNILPTEAKIKMMEEFAKIPTQMNQDINQVLMFYPEGSVMIEPIFIYQ